MRTISSLSRFRHSRLARGGIVLAIALFILAGGAYATISTLEADDSFCASCHVEPETTYYQASLVPDEATTLAAFHSGEKTRCIDCHSRRWIPGRVWAQLGGLQNFLAYRSGNFTDPAVTTRPVGDGGCSKCHSDLTWVSQRPGHYHSPELRGRWRTQGGPANSCEACHPSHKTVAPASDHFMDAELVEEMCENCHELTGEAADQNRES